MRELVYTPIRELQAAPRNPQGHDLDTLKASFGRFGFTIPILWCERKQAIAAGHGRIELLIAMQDADEDRPEGIDENEAGEWLVPVIRGWSSKDDIEFEAYLVADNRIPQLGGQDDELLTQMLQDIIDGPGLLGTGFDDPAVEELFRRVQTSSADPLNVSREWNGMPEYRSENMMSKFHVVIHFASDEEADEFFKSIDRPRRASMWWPSGGGLEVGAFSEQYV